jgi:hypothetical protein
MHRLMITLIYQNMHLKIIFADKGGASKSWRDKSNKNPANYPLDYTIRLCEAILADVGGYENRASWENNL